MTLFSCLNRKLDGPVRGQVHEQRPLFVRHRGAVAVEIENGLSMTASRGTILGLYGECIETTVFVNRFGNIAASITWAGQTHDFVRPLAATRFLTIALMGGSAKRVQAVFQPPRTVRAEFAGHRSTVRLGPGGAADPGLLR